MVLLISYLQLWIPNNDPVWQLVKRTVPLSCRALCCKTVALVGSAVKCHLKYPLASLGRTIISSKFNSQWTQRIPSSHYLSLLGSSHFPPEIVPLHRENIYEAAGEHQAPFSRSPNRQLLLYSWEVLPRGVWVSLKNYQLYWHFHMARLPLDQVVEHFTPQDMVRNNRAIR